MLTPTIENFVSAVMSYADGKEPKAYGGEFSQQLAEELAHVPLSWGIEQWAVYCMTRAEHKARKDLEVFGVKFDTWFNESLLHHSFGGRALKEMRWQGAQGKIYQEVPSVGPICINCASLLEWESEGHCCSPCPLCKNIPRI